eukprot:CAMPEP_0172463948 /NCGR_PEP_ID=MMETSP1065-20121228/48843_1 /TAXON_ID=265537 /ORGANISM="Amphiprora paludosa, Strain CCMP125" /LENGTH=272 /DNA_ID=CAMNT_0013220035 /DNA_START=8 /DNA_END=826 /DNA_ORIENTATION=-
MWSCCGIQKAVAWAVSNRYALDYVWIMEEDVHFTSGEELEALVQNNWTLSAQPQDPEHLQPTSITSSSARKHQMYRPTADLVLQMDYVDLGTTTLSSTLGGNRVGWDKQERCRQQFQHEMQWLSDTQLNQYHAFSMLNLFRVSRHFLTHLEQVFHNTGNRYGFFESFFPTLARVEHLDIDVWPYQIVRKRHSMVGRCWSYFPVPGFYHPAKWNKAGENWTKCPGARLNKTTVVLPPAELRQRRQYHATMAAMDRQNQSGVVRTPKTRSSSIE